MLFLTRLVFLLLTVLPLSALADPTTTQPTPNVLASLPLGPLIAVVGCTLTSVLLRAFTDESSFFHTKRGMLVSALASAALPAGTQAVLAHGFKLNLILIAVFGAILSAAAQYNTAGKKKKRARSS